MPPLLVSLSSQYDAASPLHHAAEEGDDLAIQALISMGANVDEADSEGQTPLMAAASWCVLLFDMFVSDLSFWGHTAANP